MRIAGRWLSAAVLLIAPVLHAESVYYRAADRTRGLDPARAGDQPSAIAIARTYETLLQYSYLERPYRLEPLLATSMPEVSEDGLTYTFRLRPGIFFQDDPCFTATGGKGREAIAEDFVYSIKRVADQKIASSGYWAFNDRIVGLDEFRATSTGEIPTDYDAPVAGLRALDRYTLQIQLKKPYPQLSWIMAMHYASAVPREAVEFYGREFVNHPVGTGPFMLNEWIPNYRMEFVRNPKWNETGRVEKYPSQGEPADAAAGHLDDAGKSLPFLDRIVDLVISDSSTRWLMFLRGQLDASEISRENWDSVVNADRTLVASLVDRGIHLAISPTLRIGYLGFNMEDPVVGTNKLLRQAITCAFNSDEWIEFNNYRVERPSGPIPRGLAGFRDGTGPFPFDLSRARKLLAEAGYPDGIDPATGRRLELTLESGRADDPEGRQTLELIAAFMERIGIRLDLRLMNGPQFFDRLDARQAQIYTLSWLGDYPDAENFLQCFYGSNASPGPNHSNYVNKEFDGLYDRIKSMQDGPERTGIYEQMADIVNGDCPWVFMSTPLAFGLRHEWFHNYKPTDFPYGVDKYYRIDVDAREQKGGAR